MATGFHGFHVLVGTIFLAVCLFRGKRGHFNKDHHFGFESWAEFIKNNKVDFRYIELMQTGDNLDYFNKYHISSDRKSVV